MKEILINHFFNYEFIYIFLVISVIFFLCAILLKKFNILKKILILLFSVFLTLSIIEFLLSLTMGYPILENSFLNLKDTQKIYTLRETHTANIRKLKEYFPGMEIKIKEGDIIFDAIYTRKGLIRLTQCNEKSKELFLFFGCSYMFGEGLADNQTLPYYFSQKFNFDKNIINCGQPGRSMNTVLNILNTNILEEYISQECKVEHVFCMVIPDLINRNFRYEKNGSCTDGYLLRNGKYYIPTMIGKIKYIFARSYIFRKVFISLVDVLFNNYYEDYMIKSLVDINELVERKLNSKLTVILWNTFPRFSDRFLDIINKSNLDIVLLPMEFCFIETGYLLEYDGHPTEKANKEIAEILYNHINEIDNKNKEN